MAKTPEIDLRENYGKNYIINGDMTIAQRGTSFSAFSGGYTLDRWNYSKSGAMVHTISQDTDVPTQAQSGYLFQNSLRLNLTTPDTSLAASEAATVHYRIEGYDFANLAQKTFTLSFWVKATLAGTYCISFRNSGNDRSYVAEYVVNSSNIWEYKTITVPASPSAGTWNYTNGTGMRITWTLAAGTDFQTTANAWQTGSFVSTANQVNGVNTGATDFRITGIQVNEGYQALPFRLFGGDIASEMIACQRYYEKSYDLASAPGSVTGSNLWWRPNQADWHHSVTFKVNKRSSPSASVYSPATGAINNIRSTDASADRAASVINVTQYGVDLYSGVNVAGQLTTAHFIADAEL